MWNEIQNKCISVTICHLLNLTWNLIRSCDHSVACAWMKMFHNACFTYFFCNTVCNMQDASNSFQTWLQNAGMYTLTMNVHWDIWVSECLLCYMANWLCILLCMNVCDLLRQTGLACFWMCVFCGCSSYINLETMSWQGKLLCKTYEFWLCCETTV